MHGLTPPPQTLPPGSTVWAYLRDSGGPNQDRSVEQQREEIAAYCQHYSLTLLRPPFQDIHRSGGSAEKRSAFNEMISTSANARLRPQGLLIWNFARFARDVDDSGLYKGLLRERKIVIHSLTDNIPEGPFAALIEMLVHISDEQKKHEAGAGAARGLRHLVRQGAVPGTPPRGFMRQPIIVKSELGIDHPAHAWVPDPELTPLIRQAFTMKSSGSTLLQIHTATHLYPSLNSYRTFFLNKLYMGTLEYSGETYENYYTPPIVDRKTWDAVQYKLQNSAQAKRGPAHPRRINSAYLLSGLVFCARCGSPMYGNTVSKTTTGRNSAYHCSRAKRRRDCDLGRISQKILEASVIYTLREYILLPESAIVMHQISLQNQASHQQTVEEKRAIKQAESRRLTTKIVNITRAIAATGHSEALLQSLKELETQRIQIANEINQLNIPIQPIPTLTDQQITALAENIRYAIENSDMETTRAILHGVIHKISVDKIDGDIDASILYYYPINPPKSDAAPPFDFPPAGTIPQGDMNNLSIESSPLGAPLYRQIYSHPMIIKKP